ncbi:hypothetical protein ACHAXS_007602 [Conticribra weissflogii]
MDQNQHKHLSDGGFKPSSSSAFARTMNHESQGNVRNGINSEHSNLGFNGVKAEGNSFPVNGASTVTNGFHFHPNENHNDQNHHISMHDNFSVLKSNPSSNHSSVIVTQTKRSKRRHRTASPRDKYIVSGRSMKRLRLDHSADSFVNNIPNGGVGVSAGTATAETTMAEGSVAQSTGTLSVGTVGTMGADLESNDEDIYDDDDDEDGASGGGEGGESVASSWVTSLPSLSSHLRRRRCIGLNNTNSGTEQRQAFWPSSAFGTTAAAGMPLPNSNPQIGRNIDEADEDDAATCAAMTTAAVAPRKHRNRSSPNAKKFKRKKRAIGFVIDTVAKTDYIAMKDQAAGGRKRDSNLDMNSSKEIQQVAQQPIRRGNLKLGEMSKRKSEELEVEELEVDSLSLDGNEVTFASIQNKQTTDPDHQLREQQSMSPPLDCIPDPLLVAAQHAAGEGMGMGTAGDYPTMGLTLNEGRGDALKDPPDVPVGEGSAHAPSLHPSPDASNNNWSLLVMGDCCSSVTEEETSLAEDEASLSAISVGGHTILSAGGDIGTVGTVSGLSAGETHGGPESEASLADPASICGMSDGIGGSNDRKLPPLAPHPGNDLPQRLTDHVKRAIFGNGSTHMLETKDHNFFKPIQHSGQQVSAVARKPDNAMPNSGYASLNRMLGSLHNERQHRKQTNLLSGKGGFRADSSMNSLGSECAGFGTGTVRLYSREEERSYSSLPGNMSTVMNPVTHWNDLQQHPPTHIQSKASLTIANGMNSDAIAGMKLQEMDVEMEATPEVGAVAGVEDRLGSGAGSVSGSLTESCANFSRASVGSSGPHTSACEEVKSGQPAVPVPKWKRQVKLPSHSSLF